MYTHIRHILTYYDAYPTLLTFLKPEIQYLKVTEVHMGRLFHPTFGHWISETRREGTVLISCGLPGGLCVK